MDILETTDLSDDQKRDIVEIWNAEYPVKLKHNDIGSFNDYLDKLTEQRHVLMLGDMGKVYGWSFAFNRNDERWFAIVLSEVIQRNGFGKFMLDKLKEKEARLCGWVTDHSTDIKSSGEPYRSPMNFYLKNGFVVLPECRLENEKMSAVKIFWEREATYDQTSSRKQE